MQMRAVLRPRSLVNGIMAALAVRECIAAVTLTFEPPRLVGAALGYYADGGFVVSGSDTPATIIMQASPKEAGAPAFVVSTDNGESFAPLNASETAACTSAVGGFNGQPVRAGPSALRNYGSVTSVPNIYANYTAFMSAGGATTFSAVPAGGPAGSGVACVVEDTPISFTGLPLPVTCRVNFGGCPFRLQGGSVVRLADGSYVYSVIVYWGGGFVADASTSLLAFGSADGAAWTFKSVIANASQYAFSQEGPNENALSLLSDGAMLLCVIRMDAGDGMATHPFVNYYAATSTDGGASWATAQEIPNAGCARPQLLHMGAVGNGTVYAAPLLLSGGRWESGGTVDVLLWTNADGMGAPGGWEDPVSVTYWHNALTPNASWAFTPGVNSSTQSPRETTAYTSILALDGGPAPGDTSRRLALTYNRQLTGAADLFFLIPFTLAW
jgi:hypothetical protein